MFSFSPDSTALLHFLDEIVIAASVSIVFCERRILGTSGLSFILMSEDVRR